MNNKILQGDDFIATKKTLRKITTDESGWNIYYIDNDSNRWIEEYPNSEYHGGGLPQLRLLEKFPWEKSNFKSDFLITRNIINDFDPCNLIESGAPSDEYDSISHKVLSFIYNKKPFNQEVQNIFQELKDSYGLDVTKDNSEILRNEIENLLIKVVASLSKHSR
ncbi:hypothetical protein FLJC2902T_32000 [Flavobacterium limnosediminis JC2902]|uniref:Uncharacterized protein n=1 Tax=Flavobacterium limnosediminis JC2902 TaxID=1341181 RepID=V6SJE4_9FLAO|nr:Imm27 family immunity protein [Flavobacterium limnosediminis]ESU24560.1 hypothetical protein FLJC2902T_32000 [Flavobacterium limnosediminis JC2902]